MFDSIINACYYILTGSIIIIFTSGLLYAL